VKKSNRSAKRIRALSGSVLYETNGKKSGPGTLFAEHPLKGQNSLTGSPKQDKFVE
jgi:hypothetical protein